jgi:hypothetical protein
MQSEPAESGRLLDPFEQHPAIPVEPSAVSNRLGWTGLEAARFSDLSDADFERPALTHHSLILCTRPPDELDLRYADVKRHRPPPLGSVSVVPAGVPVHWRWWGTKSSLYVYIQPDLIEKVAVEVFDLDPARSVLPPLDAVNIPPVAAALRAVDAELTAGGVGGSLAAESLANVLAVHLIRHVVVEAVAPVGVIGVDAATSACTTLIVLHLGQRNRFLSFGIRNFAPQETQEAEASPSPMVQLHGAQLLLLHDANVTRFRPSDSPRDVCPPASCVAALRAESTVGRNQRATARHAAASFDQTASMHG